MTPRRFRGFRRIAAAVAAAAVFGTVHMAQTAPAVRLMTLDPGHFHAALIQKEMYPGVSDQVHVYAPLGPDLVGHLGRVAAYNTRRVSPTAWRLEVHTDPDPRARMLREKPGNVVVLSGKNREKIGHVGASVDAGLHVLADKPWILRSADLPQLDRALAGADRRGAVAYDIMTERFEVTSMLQRDLVRDEAIFGRIVPGSPAEPAVYMESVHYLMKVVSGAPNIRPAWFFDTTQQGEGLNDIGTHLVDLAHWTLFPDTALDYKADVEILSAQRWPTMIPEASFKRVTGGASFPDYLSSSVKQGQLEYFCNTLVTYTTRGIHTKLNVIWDWEAAEGGDTHYAAYRGTRSRVEVRQGKADAYRTEVYIVPNAAQDKAAVLAAVRARLSALAKTYPGVGVDERGGELKLSIPDALRVGHEAHFAEVTRNFLRFLGDRRQLPAWERPNMLAKYFITTTGTELSRTVPVAVAPRIAP
jgi:predicted dehydrogenase